MQQTVDTAKIAALNDAARKTFADCRVYMTSGVQALQQSQAIAARVQAYNDFSNGDDPYGERDFGCFTFGGETIFWKIDYFDLDLQMHSPDPSDPTVTARVLTIMLAHEY